MIRPPPLLLGVGTVIWGFYCDQLVLSVMLAGLIEGLYVLKIRLDLSETDFRRILAFSAVGFIALAAYFLVRYSLREAFLGFMQWLPLIVLPMLVAQCNSCSEILDWYRLLPFLTSSHEDSKQKPLSIDLAYPYLVSCMVAASSANVRTLWFYSICILICAWGLWKMRSRQHSPFLWGGMFVLAAGIGFSVHVALNHLQHYLMDATVDLLVGEGRYTDPYSSTTRLGHLGTLKLSDRILMRVFSQSQFTAPLLLHRASYDRYLYGKWIAKDSKLNPMTPNTSGSIWTFNKQSEFVNKVLISDYLDRGAAVLSLPYGIQQLRYLPVAELKRNRLGTVQVKDDEKPVNFEVLYDPVLSIEADPTDHDLRVPKDELQTLSPIAVNLGASRLSAREMVFNVKTFFAANFAYSLSQEKSINVENALKEFLTETRYGHCEYFATATVLLLRAAGIPARYATGYAVHEYSDIEKAYVVRLRHAHAWTRAYVDKKWINLDTTPTVWVDMEQDNAPLWQPLLDVASWLWFKYSGWRFQDSDDLSQSVSITLGVLAIGFLSWWLSRKRHKPARDKKAVLSKPRRRWPGSDSEFRFIEQRLKQSRLGRKSGEPVYSWIRRISQSDFIPADAPSLFDIVSLHYRYRFSAQGIDQGQRGALADSVHEWLQRNESVLERQNPDRSKVAGLFKSDETLIESIENRDDMA